MPDDSRHTKVDMPAGAAPGDAGVPQAEAPTDGDLPADLRPDLCRLPRERLETLQAAAAEVVECHRVLAKAGLSVVGEVLEGQGAFVVDQHYPRGDIYDRETHAQYYYHAHREGEHGHFHCFLRAPGMPAGLRPEPDPVRHGWPAGTAAIAHLVAIGMDRRGFATRLFTTNRWVTGETWYPAPAVIAMLDGWAVDHARPNWAVNRWLGAMLRLFRPQIEALLIARDRVLAARPGADPWEDRTLETVTEIPIDVAAQARDVAAALARHR